MSSPLPGLPAFDGSDLALLYQENWPILARVPPSRLVFSNTTAQWLARMWLNACNTRDFGQLAEMYADDCEFSNPLIATVMGEPTGRLRGKTRILNFWEILLTREEKLSCDFFTVYRGIRSIVISYRFFLGKNALEHMEFDDAGRIIRSASSFDQIA
jgi:hypothetical protein